MTCRLKIYLDLATCQSLRKYIYKDEEMAGLLYIDSYKKDYAHLVIGAETVGYEDKVQTPLYFFSFHTHPVFLYDKHDTFAGWCSSIDFVAQLKDYNRGLRKHYIISLEGIYSLSVTLPFARWWQKLDEMRMNQLCQKIEGFFRKFEDTRQLEVVYKEIEENQSSLEIEGAKLFEKFMIATNTLTLKELNFPINERIFEIDFFSWTAIQKNGGIKESVNYLSEPNVNCEIK